MRESTPLINSRISTRKDGPRGKALRTTVCDNPKQNGIVEINNWSIINPTRTMLHNQELFILL